MMKEIQEKRIENEISLTQHSVIPSKFKKINKEEYHIEVSVPYNLIENESVKTDIVFLIHMVPNFPFSQPKVYCKTPFCFPHISDGRDILDDIISQNWVPSLRILDIINKLQDFTKEFMKNLQEGVLVLVGNYYLGEKYDLSFLESLPIYVKKVKEKVIIDNKEKEISKILLVSDIFFCLFDQEKWTKNNLHLTFWSNIRSLITIKKLIKGDTCRFFWKQKNKKNNYEMIINVENSNELVTLLLDKMSKFGINYKVSKNNLGPKQGVIPAIDIDTVEKNILEVEAKVESQPDMELMQYLMSLYEKAVEYYSATNNMKWEYYTEKIHSILKSPRIKDFLDRDQIETNNNNNNNNDHSNNGEKREISTIENVKLIEEEIKAGINPNEPNSQLIPKEKRIIHVDIAKESKIVSETVKGEEDSKTNVNIIKIAKEELVNSIVSNVNALDIKVVKETNPITSSEKNITTIVTPDQLIKNEETGYKLEIAHDEDEQQIDYSDEDDDDYEEN